MDLITLAAAKKGSNGGGGTLTPATTTKLGGIKVGDGLSIDNTGVLSASSDGPGYEAVENTTVHFDETITVAHPQAQYAPNVALYLIPTEALPIDGRPLTITLDNVVYSNLSANGESPYYTYGDENGTYENPPFLLAINPNDSHTFAMSVSEDGTTHTLKIESTNKIIEVSDDFKDAVLNVSDDIFIFEYRNVYGGVTQAITTYDELLEAIENNKTIFVHPENSTMRAQVLGTAVVADAPQPYIRFHTIASGQTNQTDFLYLAVDCFKLSNNNALSCETREFGVKYDMFIYDTGANMYVTENPMVLASVFYRGGALHIRAEDNSTYGKVLYINNATDKYEFAYVSGNRTGDAVLETISVSKTSDEQGKYHVTIDSVFPLFNQS